MNKKKESFIWLSVDTAQSRGFLDMHGGILTTWPSVDGKYLSICMYLLVGTIPWKVCTIGVVVLTLTQSVVWSHTTTVEGAIMLEPILGR